MNMLEGKIVADKAALKQVKTRVFHNGGVCTGAGGTGWHWAFSKGASADDLSLEESLGWTGA